MDDDDKPADCPLCEDLPGPHLALAPCTTFGQDCACNGPRVEVDICPACGIGRVEASDAL